MYVRHHDKVSHSLFVSSDRLLFSLRTEEIILHQSRLTEHQDIAVLKSIEAACIVKNATMKPAITTGKRSLAV